MKTSGFLGRSNGSLESVPRGRGGTKAITERPEQLEFATDLSQDLGNQYVRVTLSYSPKWLPRFER